MREESATRHESGDAIDLGHLERQAGGEIGLVRELLAIFATAIVPDGRRMVGMDMDEASRRALAHRIKGASLGIGAFALARAAARLAEPGDDAPATEAFALELDRVAAAIDALLASE